MNRRLQIATLLAAPGLLALAAIGGSAYAALPGPAAPTNQAVKQPLYSDDFDKLPNGLKGVSMSTLVNSGKVHAVVHASQPSGVFKALAPLLNITWGAPMQTTTTASGEPATGMHPTNPLFALVSGNITVDNTTNGGVTWQSRNPPNASGYGDVVNAWLEGGAGNQALEVALNPSSDGANYTCGRSSDFGVTWTADGGCGTSLSTTFFDDREYLWVDRNPSSPFYGRVYLTGALFDAAGSGSFNTVTNRWSSDQGATWNPPSALPLGIVAGNEFALGLNHNEYPSMGISANGTIGYAWHRGACCGGFSPINAPNKVMFARSTDGGVSFPFSTTVVTVPLNQTVPFNSTSPLGVRWSDTPNIAADPVTNGTFYAVWTQYRTPNTAASAAIYLSKTTDNGATWSTPVIPYNNPNASIFQGFGWVKATTDHTIHVTFTSGTTSNTTVAHFYVQSTDGGATWSTPFQLSAGTFGPFGTTTDYEAMDVSGTNGGAGSILAGWAQNTHYARMGTFVQGTPTPTVTGTPPTVTPTRTSTQTPTATATPCQVAGLTNGGFETGSLAPWVVQDTSPPPVVSTAQAHSGTYSALLGTVSGGEPNGNGSIYQGFTVPAGATLSFWYYPGTTDSLSFDWQDVYLTDSNGAILATIMHVCENDLTWKHVTFNLAPYVGQSVRVKFLVHQDGFGDDTYMYVDDVQLLGSCATGTPATATRTVTAGPSPSATATPCGAPSAWTAGPALPSPVVRSVGVYFPANGKFYVMGGRSSDSAGSDLTHPLEYTPGNPGTWATKAGTYPDNQVNNMACGVLTVGGTPYIYCVGGSAAGATTATARVFRYNPATDTVSAVSGDNWPGDASGTILPGGVAVLNNKLYTIGGFDINVAMTNQIWEYDPNAAGSHWTQKVNLPVARGYVPAAAIGSFIYIAGGSDYTTTLVDTSDSFKFDPAANTVTAITSIPRATGETRALNVGGQLWVLGGGRTPPNPSNEVDIYNPATNAWTVGMPFSEARRNFAADTDGSTVWIAGGYDSSGTNPLDTMEIYRSGGACGSPTVTVTVPAPTTTATQPAATATQPAATATQPAVTATRTSAPATATQPAATATRTSVPPSATRTAGPTATPCNITFSDVHPTDYFYTPVLYLACHNVISGYSDGTFRPYNNTTRSQMVKIVTLGFAITVYTPPAGGYTFTDVPPSNPFFSYIETAAHNNIVSGYTCGADPSEPCDAQNRPYFRPYAYVTRGQLSKIVVVAAGWTQINPATQSFQDVFPNTAFYTFVETAYCHGIISGYDCGGPGEPCGTSGKPYFRQFNNATRGQIAKIVYGALTSTQTCATPSQVNQ